MELEALAGQLCLAAGTIMEDATAGAISTNMPIAQRVADLDSACELLRALATAASALLRYHDRMPS